MEKALNDSGLAAVTQLTKPNSVGAVGLYLGLLSPSSRRAALWRLNVAQTLLDAPIRWQRLSYADAIEIRGRAAERYAPSTANAILAAVKSVLKQAWLLGEMSAETYQRIASVPAIRGSSAPKGRHVTRVELRAMFDTCDVSTNSGARDAAMLALLFGVGLRRSEIVALVVSDIDSQSVTIRGSKNNKSRKVRIGASVKDALAPWIAIVSDGVVMRSINKGGVVAAKGMSGEGLRRRLQSIANRASIAPFTPHDSRRTYAGIMLDSGVDVAVLARMMGHASIQVTATYDRRDERAEQAAAEMMRLPFASPCAETNAQPFESLDP